MSEEKCLGCHEDDCDLYSCYICGAKYCEECQNKSRYRAWSNSWNESIAICITCIENRNLYMDKKRYIRCDYFEVELYYETVEKYENQVEELKNEIERLQTMVDYQPGGKGYVEAKHHFEELSKK